MLPHLVDAVSHSLQRELSGSIHRLAVISWSPAGAVDVNNLGHVTDGRCLNDVGHKGLIQHPDTLTQQQLDVNLTFKFSRTLVHCIVTAPGTHCGLDIYGCFIKLFLSGWNYTIYSHGSTISHIHRIVP